jgi:hypothetical protein
MQAAKHERAPGCYDHPVTRPRYWIRAYRLGVLQVERDDGTQLVETRDLTALRHALGDEVLGGLLRLFVWVDRMSSLIHLGYWSNANLPAESPALARDLQTVVWFASGVLFEAADAIEQLSAAGIESQLSTRDHWNELKEMADRWTGNILRRGRNNIGFHADPRVMLRGIEALAGTEEKVQISVAEGRTTSRASFRLGLEALLLGTGFSLAQFDQMFTTLAADLGRFRDLVGYVWVEVLQFHGAWSPEAGVEDCSVGCCYRVEAGRAGGRT